MGLPDFDEVPSDFALVTLSPDVLRAPSVSSASEVCSVVSSVGDRFLYQHISSSPGAIGCHNNNNKNTVNISLVISQRHYNSRFFSNIGEIKVERT